VGGEGRAVEGRRWPSPEVQGGRVIGGVGVPEEKEVGHWCLMVTPMQNVLPYVTKKHIWCSEAWITSKFPV
jgi:hypothetical protein